MLEPRTELWCRVLESIDPETLRATIYRIDVDNLDEDGRTWIRAAASDGRFYYLDEHGETLRIELADRWLKDFGDASAPALSELPLRGE